MNTIIALLLILICILAICSMYVVLLLWRRMRQLEHEIMQKDEAQKHVEWLVFEYVSEIEQAGAAALETLKMYEQQLTMKMRPSNTPAPDERQFDDERSETNALSRMHRVAALAEQGVSPEEIGRRLHIGLDEVRLILRITHKQGENKTAM